MNQQSCICFLLLYLTVETTDQITTPIPTDGSTVYTADDTTKTAGEISTYEMTETSSPENTRNTAGVISTNRQTVTSTRDNARNTAGVISTDEPTVTSTIDDTRNTAGVISTDEPTVTSTIDDTRNTAGVISTDEPTVTSTIDDTRNTAGVISTDEPTVTSTIDDTRNTAGVISTDEPTVTSTMDDTRNTAGVISTDQLTVTFSRDDTRNTADVILTEQPTVTSTHGDTRNSAGMISTDQPTVTSTRDDARNTVGVISTDQPTVTSTRGDTRNTADVISTEQPTVTFTLHGTRNTADVISTNRQTVTSTRGDTRNTAGVISTDRPTFTSTRGDTRNTAGLTYEPGFVTDPNRSGNTEEKAPDDQTGLTIVQSTPGDALVDLCDIFGSCPPEHKVDSWYCRCDDLCQVYNDCCKEYQPTAFLPRQDIYRCLRTNLEKSNFIGMFVISVCPDYFQNTTIVNGCLKDDITSGTPVFDRNDESRIFANQFCAICNSVQDTTPLPIQLYNLPRRVDLEELLGLGSVENVIKKYGNVKYRLLQKDPTKYRSCLSRVEMSGSPECQKYVNPLLVLYGGRESYYRNNFCVEESIRINLTESNVICFPGLSFSFVEIQTLSVIFNFGVKKSQDDDSNMCKVWTKEIDDDCSHLTTYVNVEEPMELIFETSSNQTDDSLIRIGLVVMWTHIEPEVTELLDTADVSKADEGQIVKVSMNLVIRKRCFADEIKTMHTKIRERSFRISIKMGDEEIELTKVNDSYTNKTFTQLRSLRMLFPIEMFFQKYDITKATKQRKNICLAVTISLEQNENSLDISSFVCEIPTDRSSVTAEAIATYACFSVSIVAMVPLIIVNRRIDDVMTIPRTNLENIAISLILAYSLFMAGIGMTSMPTVCYFIGIGLHYLFLAVFVFMTIGVFTAAIAINRLREKRNAPQSQMNRVLLTLLGLSISLIIVGTAVAVDRVGPSRWSPGYSDTTCFPTRFPGNIAFFTGPMMLMITVDTICIINIIVQVERTKMETRKLLKTSTMFDDLKMYLRLVVLGGVLWLIGIVAAVVGWDWLDFAFVLLCGLHGFFISVASLTTQESKKTIKAMFDRT